MVKEEFRLDEKLQEFEGWHSKENRFIHISYVKKFIKKRVFDATMLLGKFNAGNLTSIDLREHRQKIKDESGDKLV